MEQASQVVLVVGVERVVRDRDAAVFVARAQARYGVLSVALSVLRRGGDSKGELPAGQSLTPSPPARDVQRAPMHVILLDNGRRAWLRVCKEISSPISVIARSVFLRRSNLLAEQRWGLLRKKRSQ